MSITLICIVCLKLCKKKICMNTFAGLTAFCKSKRLWKPKTWLVCGSVQTVIKLYFYC